MATDFQLTAEIVLTGPRGLGQVAKNIQKELQLSPNTVGQYDALNKNIIQSQKAISSLHGAVTGLGKSFNKTQRVITQTGTSVKQTGRHITQSSGAMEEFGRTVGFVTSRLIGFRIASAIVVGFGGSLRTAVGDAIDFEKQLIKVAQVTNKDISQLSRLSAEITRLSVTYGASSKELVVVSKTLSQAGLSARDTRIALEALAKSTLLPTFGDMNATAEGAIAIFNQFELEAKDLWSVLSAVDAVTGALAVEASDVTIAVQKLGGLFAALNKDVDNGAQSFNEFLAIFSSVRQTTRESASNIAVGLRTIFARIQRPKTIEFLREFGVELTNLNGQLLKPIDILDKLSEAFGSIGARNLNIGQIVEILGGTRQVAKVLPLLFQQELRQRALRIANEASTDSNDRLNKAMGILATTIAKVREEFSALIREVVQGSVFQNIAGGILMATSGLIKFLGALKPILPALVVLSGINLAKAVTPFARGLVLGFRGNPLTSGAGIAEVSGTGTNAIATQQQTIQRSAIHSNTTALMALTRQLQRMVLGGGGGGAGRQYAATPFSSRGKQVPLSASMGTPFYLPQNQFIPSTAIPKDFTKAIKDSKIRSNVSELGQKGSDFIGRHYFGASMGAAIGGNLAASYIGRETRGKASVSGALSGAGTGALMGSVIGGPVGAGFGLFGGALFGAISAVKTFNETLRQNQIEDSLEELEKTFTDFGKGRISASKALANIAEQTLITTTALEKTIPKRTQLDPSYHGGYGGPGDFNANRIKAPNTVADIEKFGREYQKLVKGQAEGIFKTLQSQFSQNTTEYQQTLQALSAGMISLDDASKVFLKDVPDEVLQELGAIFQNVGEAAQKSGGNLQKYYKILREEIGKPLTVEQVKVTAVTKAVNKLNIALDFTEDNIRRFAARLQVIVDVAGQGTLAASRRSLSRAQGQTLQQEFVGFNPFKNIQGFSAEAIAQELTDLGIGGQKFYRGGNIGDELAGRVNLARAMPDILRNIASKLSGSSSTDIINDFQQELYNILPAGSEVLNILTEKLGGLGSKEPVAIFEEIVKDLKKITDPAVTEVRNYVDARIKFEQDRIEAENQKLALGLSNIALLSKIRSNLFTMLNDSVVARGGTLSVGQKIAPTVAQLRTLGVGTNFGQIMQTRQFALTSGDESLVGKTNMALEVLANSMDALTAIQTKIADFEKRRSDVSAHTQGVFLMSSEQRQEMIKQIRAFNNFMGGGRLTQEAVRGGQLKVQDLQRNQQVQQAAWLDTFLTRSIGRATGIRNAGMAAQGQAAPQQLLNAEKIWQQQILSAQSAQWKIQYDASIAFLNQSNQAHRERMRDLRMSLGIFDETTTDLSNTLKNFSIPSTIELKSTHEVIDVHFSNGDVLVNAIADKIKDLVIGQSDSAARSMSDPTNLGSPPYYPFTTTYGKRYRVNKHGLRIYKIE